MPAGIFEGMDLLKDDTFRAQAYQWMGEGYGMPADEVEAMAVASQMTDEGRSTREIARRLRGEFGMTRNQAYELALKVAERT